MKSSRANGPFEITDVSETEAERMTILIWGPAGDGKTTLAATAPGRKLWLALGDNEHQTLIGRSDVEVMHLYRYNFEDVIKHGKSSNPFGLDHILAEDERIQTVVLDSTTALVDMALRYAVKYPSTESKKSTFVPTMEHPGMTAYGGRNQITLEVLRNLLTVTAKHGVHLIMTAHENDPATDDAGVVMFITVMLGGKIMNNVTWRLSEIWYLSNDSKGRQLAVRQTRKHRPMKSRMFTGIGEPEFILSYDSNKPDKGQMTIAGFYEQWIKTGKKLPIPTSRRDK